MHLSIGVMPVTRLKLFAFLARYLAQFPFWCQRLALVQPGEPGHPASTENDTKSWEDMCAQLHALLAHKATYQAFLAYLVDAQRAYSGASPAHHP